MKFHTMSSVLNTGLFTLQNKEFLENQRIAGKVAVQCLDFLENLIKSNTSLTTLKMSEIVEEIILDNHCTPTFKNYKGFPGIFCISVNKELTHGIPKDYVLQNGDLVSFDIGVTYKESIADTATTIIYGEPKNQIHIKLIDSTKECLAKGIQSIKIDRRLGSIGNAIYKCAKGYGFHVISNYGGHAIGLDENGKGVAHAPPFVANKADINEGIRIQEGMVIAIEPLLSLTSNQTKVMLDGWTVETLDINCHVEQSIFVHNDHVEIVTWRQSDKKHLPSNKVYFK